MKEECTIAVCGPVDAGKSSLIGVLTSGELDDGRGLARNKVLIHPHERETGRTSHITYNPLIYNKKDNSTINLVSFKESKNIMEIKTSFETKWDSKITSFIDLAGHEKYLKTTIFGVTGMFPDYGIVVIGANTGITKLTREHIGILLYLNIPFIISITKIDMAPKDVYQNLCNQLKKLLGKSLNDKKKILYFINNEKETDDYIKHMLGNSDVIPIITISNKTGININNLHQILYHLPRRDKWEKIDGSIFYIDATFLVPGIGLVVSGTNKGNPINIRQKLYLGPFAGNEFKEVVVRSIHNTLSQNVEEAESNLQSTLAIKLTNNKDTLDKSQIRKGMVLIDNYDKFKNFVTKKFIAKINILHHSTTIKSGYSPVIHCGPIRQSASLKLSDQILRNGDTCDAEFEFKYHPEFLEKDMIFFFRDGTTKGVGTVMYRN